MLFYKLKYVCLSLMLMLSFTYSQTVDLSFGAADDQGAEVLISIPVIDPYCTDGQYDNEEDCEGNDNDWKMVMLVASNLMLQV